MSQKAFLRDLDASIVGSLRDAGMADTGTYTPPGGGAAIPDVDCLVDRNVAFFGEDQATVAGYRDVVTLFLDQVPAPARGGTVVVDGDTFTLDALDEQDASKSRWVVVDG